MRKDLRRLTVRFIVLLMLMSGITFSRHFCDPSEMVCTSKMRVDCCGNTCEPETSAIPAKNGSDGGCCHLVSGVLFIPAYSIQQTFSPDPVILSVLGQECNSISLTLGVAEVSLPREIALQGYPPGTEIESIRVFRI